MRKPLMGLTLGDAAGIGPELALRALQSEDILQLATWVVIGDERVFRQGQAIAGATVSYQRITDIGQVNDEHQIYFIDLNNLPPESYTLGQLSVDSGRATGETLTFAVKLAQQNKLDGVVYAPINKEALHRGGFHFQDELHFFASLLDCTEGFSEINVMNDLWVTRITSHVPIRQVGELITQERVGRIIRFAHDTLTRVGFDQPRIAVAALNPHAGDGGLLGMEEIEEIRPAVQEAREQGIEVDGPYPADTIFLRRQAKPFDCLVSMYHDQAQTPMKLLGFNRGVTVSGGLPVVLATPAHGTAFDIAGQGTADPGATEQAMKLAVRLAGF
ncbi:4-hydroxythreonine-4-phosphate dehydrogenase PdxA [Paenibacillus filicis]|uniref:4-hydroxythreonine-4-phosphate dehydrogenase PdxA n=1 Tax=Paenibacillus filicis TaxID=669464 RepID=A0ABU9DN50_9BACL